MAASESSGCIAGYGKESVDLDRVLYMSGFAARTLEQGVLDAKEAFLAKPYP